MVPTASTRIDACCMMGSAGSSPLVSRNAMSVSCRQQSNTVFGQP